MHNSYVEKVMAASSSLLVIIAPKFCCWSSALAAVSSGASYLAWVYPVRPYLFIFSFFLAGRSLYKAYQPVHPKKTGEGSECEVCKKDKTHLLKSKQFSWMVAVFVLLMLVLSYF
jgi:mercuric ion transport protein